MYARSTLRLMSGLLFLVLGWLPLSSYALCVDNVVMVHGNAGYPSHFDNTYNLLISQGYQSWQIVRPNWGSKTCPACNSHDSTNTAVVRNAIASALSNSCTGKVDVIGHSMGVTLAANAIMSGGYAGRVDSFVGIAGGYHGLNSCGVYPFNVWTPTCGSQGLSINSPFINSLRGFRVASRRITSVKSWIDEIVCAGSCFVYGSHTSNIDYQTGSVDFALGHMGLVYYTANTQYDLIR